MATTRTTFNLDLYPPTAVSEAAHRLSGTHMVRVKREADRTVVLLTPRVDGHEDVTAALFDAVLDEALRSAMLEQTTFMNNAASVLGR